MHRQKMLSFSFSLDILVHVHVKLPALLSLEFDEHVLRFFTTGKNIPSRQETSVKSTHQMHSCRLSSFLQWRKKSAELR